MQGKQFSSLRTGGLNADHTELVAESIEQRQAQSTESSWLVLFNPHTDFHVDRLHIQPRMARRFAPRLLKFLLPLLR